ncbi:restriction endonuclease [Candidatus Saccharibacteria bacterium]|nr:restriction endonuclease [Candidatus Saccharibacteria bacterium]MBH1972847.1 restriction endonuclease [Candidatus Saccharibacteria bacterium]MBH1991048.1 restriction endonuclease [Candidatus Saccharibacteria bacterium]
MSRHSRAQSDNVSFVIVVLVGAAAWTHRAEFVHIAYIAFGLMCCLLVLKLSWKLLGRRRFAQFKNIDAMDGLEFERYVAGLLRKNGFCNVSLTEKYDFGVDIIAEKDGVRWGVQVKHYSGLVKASAVRQVVTGLKLYGCDRAMVVTNSTYSATARKLAAGNDCELIDRRSLALLTGKK